MQFNKSHDLSGIIAKKDSRAHLTAAHLEQLYMFVDAIDELGELDKCISIHEMRRVLRYIRESLAPPKARTAEKTND